MAKHDQSIDASKPQRSKNVAILKDDIAELLEAHTWLAYVKAPLWRRVVRAMHGLGADDLTEYLRITGSAINGETVCVN